MYVCMYVCMHVICTYVCMHVCVDLCLLFNVDVRVNVCSYVSMCIGTHVCVFKDSLRILVLVCTHSQARCTGPGVVPFGITL